MTDQVINFTVRKASREKEIEAADHIVLRHAIVAQAITQMQEFSSDADILKTLRCAIDVFQRSDG